MKLWVARFWSKIKVTDDDDSCWLWKAAKSGSGYGVFTVTENGFRQSVDAHTLAYTLHYGTIPEGRFVLHRCNKKLCCNPKHLYAGTQIEKMWVHRRHSGGARRKLTHAKELLLRADFKAGVKQHALAHKYGISDSTVSRILHDPDRNPKGVK